MADKEWKRKEYTTESADPTVVVTWTNGDVEIEEFQDVYGTRFSTHVTDENGELLPRDFFGNIETHYSGPIAMLGRELHKTLERAWQAEFLRHWVRYPANRK